MSTTRRTRRVLATTGIAAAAVLATTLGSYAVVRALPAEFPLVYSERLDPAALQGVSVADPATALTFARVATEDGPTVLAVTGYDDGTIRGTDVNATAGTSFTDPIGAFAELGYTRLQAIATDPTGPRLEVTATQVLPSFETHAHHVGTGTNYAEHQAEATIEEPFLFPKIAKITGPHEDLPTGNRGLLDYEVELGLVALDDITAETGVPQHMGLVLSNDWTDRELLTEQIEPDDLTRGAGFTNAKSQPGFLSTGNLFVIPADWQTYYKDLRLELFVNGDLRQQADPDEMIWDAPTMIEKTLDAGTTTWDSDGTPTQLTERTGVITRGTILQSGTPQGVVYRAPDTRQRFLGFMEYAASLGTNADSVVDSALEVYVRDAHRAGVYLKPGDQVVTRADGLGQIVTTIVAGDRPETEPQVSSR